MYLDFWLQFWLDLFYATKGSNPDRHMDWTSDLIHPCLTAMPWWYCKADNDN